MLKNISMASCVFITSLLFMNVYADQTAWQLPDNLKNVAEQIGCSPVPGFYNRPGLENPDYAVGELFIDGQKGSVFWCSAKREDVYTLIILRGGQIFKELKFNNYPGGLSIVKKDKVDLRGFMSYEEGSSNNRSVTLENVTLIKSEYDGVVMYVLWYCDSWYYKILH